MIPFDVAINGHFRFWRAGAASTAFRTRLLNACLSSTSSPSMTAKSQ